MRRFLTWLVALTLVGAAAQAQTLTSTAEGQGDQTVQISNDWLEPFRDIGRRRSE